VIKRRTFLEGALGTLGAGSVLGAAQDAATGASGRPNVLLIGVDDLRPELGCYGKRQMVTPHLDGLASGSAMLRSNYCQQAVCSPSRTSVLTGCRPDTTKVYDLVKHFRSTLPDVVTLPQHFKNNGYFSEALGKVYHEDLDDPPSWSVPAALETVPEEQKQYQLPRSYEQERERGRQLPSHGLVYGPAIETADAPEEHYLDARITTEAVQRLENARGSRQHFFLAVGYHKPHLPFVCPKKYWDLYDKASIEVPQAKHKPEGAPDMAMTNFEELRHYYGMALDKEPLADALSRDLIHAYYACVSFLDSQIGRLLHSLEEKGLARNTIVVLWVDHGWHLGDHGLWCKHTNFEHATQVPLMIRAPGLKQAKISALTENVDLYPTLCELAGLPVPQHLEGTSLLPLLRAPRADWKSGAFSQYPRGRYMGYSLRTSRYRFTRWKHTDSGETGAEELYDYQADPLESVNLAIDAKYATLCNELRRQSDAGWRGAKPRH
jgi:iduronate 2-sulfatase